MPLTPAPPTLLAEFRDPDEDTTGYVPVIGWDDEGRVWVQPMRSPEPADMAQSYAQAHGLEYLGLVGDGSLHRGARRPWTPGALNIDTAQR
jgi:hypothetical protein